MLLSSTHNFLFIHIPKTAGTSVSHALEPFDSSPSFSAKAAVFRSLPIRRSPDKAWFQQHDTARFVRKRLGKEVYHGYTSFAFVRNPFTHAVSHYTFLKNYHYPKIARQVSAMGFEDYLDWRAATACHGLKPRVSFFARLPDQSYFVTDRRGEIIVDRILRFEALQAELCDIMAEFGIRAPALGNYRKTRSGAAPIYSARAVAAINTIYDRDFALFGYPRTPPESPEGR